MSSAFSQGLTPLGLRMLEAHQRQHLGFLYEQVATAKKHLEAGGEIDGLANLRRDIADSERISSFNFANQYFFHSAGLARDRINRDSQRLHKTCVGPPPTNARFSAPLDSTRSNNSRRAAVFGSEPGTRSRMP